MGNAAAIGREIRGELSRVLSETMLRAKEYVTIATPVDTHHAESNWILSIGHPFNGIAGSRQAVSFAEQEAGDIAVEKYDIGRDGPIISLRNNVLYMQFLDDGSSPQAEAGFVARAFAAAASGAPPGRRRAARKLLKNMARSAYLRTY